MPRVGFGPTTPVYERAKTVHALDRAATVIGSHLYLALYKYLPMTFNFITSLLFLIFFIICPI
jgi:hypothetical protein